MGCTLSRHTDSGTDVGAAAALPLRQPNHCTWTSTPSGKVQSCPAANTASVRNVPAGTQPLERSVTRAP